MLKNKTLLILSITLLIISFIEILFYVSWKISKLKYFENINNYNEKINSTTDISFLKNDNEQIVKGYKIALFGGSTIKGFGSALNIEELLTNKNFLNNNDFKIHNFAEYGKSFSGHQSKVLNKVIDKYDIFFIHSGHNEFKMIRNTNNIDDKNIEFFPNGLPLIPNKHSKISDSELSNYIRDILSMYGEFTFKEKVFNLFKNNSRIYFFSKRVNSRLGFLKIKKKAEENKEFALIRFSHKFNLYNKDAKLEIVNLYKKNLLKIIKNLNENQKIIISTLASNDLFSPFGDTNLIDTDEDKLENIFKKLNSNLDFSKIQANNISDGSNKNYILGMQCLEFYGYTLNEQSKKCYNYLLKARRLDSMPLRVFPELNEFIRSLKNNPQIAVIDLEIEILKRIKTQSDYLSYFTDFHHISPKGHLLLANLLLNKIDKSIKITNIDELKIDNCGNTQKIDINKNFIQDLITVPVERCKWPLMAIERLINSQLKYNKKTIFYDHYLNQAKN